MANMEEFKEAEIQTITSSNGETSIFDEVKALPVYFSERAVFVFSLLFGVLFGSVLMAVNLKNSKEKKGIWQVIVFGILYSSAAIYILELIPKSNSGLTIGLNGGGAYVLKLLFWDRYIGKDVNYTKRSVLIPAIVGAVIAVAVIAAIFALGITV